MSSLVRIIECLQFESCGRSFCVDVDQVLGLISMPPNVKEVPPFIPFHGAMVPVYPMERILELEEQPRVAPPEVLVVKDDAEYFGIAVDWVGEIHKVPVQRAMFRFPDSDHSNIKMFGIWGMVALNNKLALIMEPLSMIKKLRSRDLVSNHAPLPIQNDAPLPIQDDAPWPSQFV